MDTLEEHSRGWGSLGISIDLTLLFFIKPLRKFRQRPEMNDDPLLNVVKHVPQLILIEVILMELLAGDKSDGGAHRG
ncbi:hypothetical protein LP421_16110 [Rhizobium sp. RCAM05350]|nr:hypothetical protein LP421_16110 [Rhizobium sp. RCAM05350]